MPTFQKCDKSVEQLLAELLSKYDTNQPLLKHGVKVELLFAFADLDDDGNPVNDAMTHKGHVVRGEARKIPLKQRVAGRGDAEIALNGDIWQKLTEDEQAALLDHELQHIALKEKHGVVQMDSAGRPQLRMRDHDIQTGWFSVIAARHGEASMERIDARHLMETKGQFYFPELCEAKAPLAIGTGKLAKRTAVKLKP